MVVGKNGGKAGELVLFFLLRKSINFQGLKETVSSGEAPLCNSTFPTFLSLWQVTSSRLTSFPAPQVKHRWDVAGVRMSLWITERVLHSMTENLWHNPNIAPSNHHHQKIINTRTSCPNQSRLFSSSKFVFSLRFYVGFWVCVLSFCGTNCHPLPAGTFESMIFLFHRDICIRSLSSTLQKFSIGTKNGHISI